MARPELLEDAKVENFAKFVHPVILAFFQKLECLLSSEERCLLLQNGPTYLPPTNAII